MPFEQQQHLGFNCIDQECSHADQHGVMQPGETRSTATGFSVTEIGRQKPLLKRKALSLEKV
jgi:hypothetical protein